MTLAYQLDRARELTLGQPGTRRPCPPAFWILVVYLAFAAGVAFAS